MGVGVSNSNQLNRAIYIEYKGKIHKIVFSKNATNQEIQDLVKSATKTSNFKIVLKDRSDNYIQLTASIALNSSEHPYKLEATEATASVNGTSQVMENNRTAQDIKTQEALSQIVKEFSKAIRFDESKKEIIDRISQIEQRLDVESLKAIELEKFRKEIKDLRDLIHNSSIRNSDSISNRHFDRKLSFENIPTYPKYQLSQETIQYLKTPTFNIWHWEPNEMLALLEHMYHELGLVKEFNMNHITLKRWLLCVQANYRNNPFHNFRHCFCVAQMMYGMIHLCNLQSVMSKTDLVVLLTSAICHDLDHPGYNNAYQINARTELAIRYNDISPLENHHCAVAFQILSNPSCNIFANVPEELFKEIRMGMVKLILATDMAKHKEIMDELVSYLPKFDFKKKEHLDSLKCILIKCCDISNEVRPIDVSEPWLDCLLEEYFNQSDREKIEGLPVAPFMDREKVTKSSAQLGFIKFVLVPLFETIAKVFPAMEQMVTALNDSYNRYNELKLQEESSKNGNGTANGGGKN